MATYVATKAGTTEVARHGLATCSVVSSYELSAALAEGDVVQMLKVPIGAKVVAVTLATDDLDTNVSPAIVLEVGDGSDTNRFVVSATVGQGGGVTSLNAIDGLGYRYSSEDTIDVRVATAPATGATTGTVTLSVIYDMNS